mmetsp:Transcript_18625/g.40334  ORF Transcript_18625/g.40334 Transcript_18625/m.40334 type:complete len:227 (-) Transcript_18625:1169-1849(-)
MSLHHPHPALFANVPPSIHSRFLLSYASASSVVPALAHLPHLFATLPSTHYTPLIQLIHLLPSPIIITRSPHGNQFLGTRRMNSNSVIKVILRSTHLDGNSHTLDHFTGTIRSNMTSHHALCLRFYNEFEERIRLTLREGVLHGSETILVHVNVSELCSRIFFSVPNRTNFRCSEYSGSNEFMIHWTILAPKQRIGESMSLHQRHGCQCNTIGDISHSVDALDVGL